MHSSIIFLVSCHRIIVDEILLAWWRNNRRKLSLRVSITRLMSWHGINRRASWPTRVNYKASAPDSVARRGWQRWWPLARNVCQSLFVAVARNGGSNGASFAASQPGVPEANVGHVLAARR